MIVKKMVLENIRSYINSEIDFPNGSVLLAGDIGSGKSTVLMAIDFALFGIKRGELSGASLLRNGKGNGKVELHFEIDGKNIEICRTLKRTSSGVSQDSGFISINGEKKTGTAIELKQNILELLNYPMASLTKNDLLFRYTVYTSQEQMKQILLCEKEERFDTLRKVFGIDKYKRISENASIVISRLKEKSKELKGYVSDLSSKKEELRLQNEKRREYEDALNSIAPKLEESEKNLEEKRKQMKEIEKQIENARKARQGIEMAWLKIKSLRQQLARNEADVNMLSKALESLKCESLEARDFSAEITSAKSDKNEAEKILRGIHDEMQTLKVKKSSAEEKAKKVRLLGNCPTCYQEVSEEHKAKIANDEENAAAMLDEEIKKCLERKKEAEEKKALIEKEIEKLIEEDKKSVEIRARIKEKDEKLSRKKSIEEHIGIIKKDITEAENEIMAFSEDAKEFEGINGMHMAIKAEIEALNQINGQLRYDFGSAKAKIGMAQDYAEKICREIQLKEESMKTLDYLSKLQEWIGDSFIPLMGSMEKHIMQKVHSDFGSLFSKWFSMLVDNDSMSIRLDSEFTPVIEQNGYETEYDFLSGGEKTAAALAYRLALNQVINDIMSAIKTRSIIILDEPTDGFSSEQLERMKNVLDELNMGQIIIVSHEPKIESFVQSVIRFDKKEHSSRIV